MIRLSRRRVLTGAGGAIPAAAAIAAAHSRSPRRIDIFSPASGTIEIIADGRVETGAVLIRILDHNVARERHRAESLAQSLKITRQPLDDGHYGNLVGLKHSEVALARVNLSTVRDEAEWVRKGYKDSITDGPWNYSRGYTRESYSAVRAARIAQAQAEIEVSELQARHATLALEDAAQLFAILERYVDVQNKFVTDLERTRTFNAPRPGLFAAIVGTSSYVVAGSKVGSLEY